jgi:hypothetical protein
MPKGNRKHRKPIGFLPAGTAMYKLRTEVFRIAGLNFDLKKGFDHRRV